MASKKVKEKTCLNCGIVTHSYEEFKQMVDDHILDFMPDVDPKSKIIKDAMEYSLLSGGKRVRPVLLLAACEFCGGNVQRALPYAIALEYIHTYSLIHDDLPAMDDDDMRRGKPSNHKKFGDAIAILAGDALLNSAFEIMLRELFIYFDDDDALKRKVRAMHAIATGAGCRGMIAGQVADIEAVGKVCSKEMIEYIHLNKTATLIETAMLAGAFLGQADNEMRKNLSIYGENLGLAFQIRDDILDIEGKMELLGKNTGVDCCKGKCTYPAIFGIEESKAKLKELGDRARQVIAPYYDNADFFKSLINKLEERNS